MRLLFESESGSELAEAKELLEESGIPAFISSQETYRVRSSATLFKRGLWVCLEEQYQDAAALLKDPNHRVAWPVDVEAFHRSLEEAQKQPFSALGLDKDKLLNFVMAVLIIAFVAAGAAMVLFT